MSVNYNSITSSGNINLQSASLSPTSQTIVATASSINDFGVTIDYYLNNTFVTTYSDTTLATTGNISTTAGNTYKFIGTSGS